MSLSYVLPLRWNDPDPAAVRELTGYLRGAYSVYPNVQGADRPYRRACQGRRGRVADRCQGRRRGVGR